ncbi:hypothetical protein [Phyllobacterium zundukense]|uniref:Uncharacterized protein n=1 Tax=Phyllobacterium zundukense TaxID=1867719 RepID=A0ACD4CX78_9HYPH|nr:hypothetical protein [Phyllobacterium zundukense]UXN58181.1 hypothetical protein N8E88_05000 [Phyllobacterium zundukense]
MRFYEYHEARRLLTAVTGPSSLFAQERAKDPSPSTEVAFLKSITVMPGSLLAARSLLPKPKITEYEKHNDDCSDQPYEVVHDMLLLDGISTMPINRSGIWLINAAAWPGRMELLNTSVHGRANRFRLVEQ